MTIANIFKAVLLTLILGSFTISASAQELSNEALTREILKMDSVLFGAFNAKNITALKNVFSKDLEFYHDKGGVANYAQNIENTEKLFANVPDLNRQLVPGSTKVFPIKGFGAIQTGAHRFCHKENGKDDCGVFQFLHIWKQTPEGWKLVRIVSYDH